MSAAGLLAENLLPWLVQVTVVAMAGTLLPSLLRIRHPRTLLAYYEAVFALCFILPVLQSWQHPLLLLSTTPTKSALPVDAGFSWSSLLLIALVAGCFLKLSWLALGLFQLRRCRKTALPLSPLPESIVEARLRTGADATFCISREIDGPATMGYRNPLVLLPESFLTLSEEAQQSIACHELLHVRRRDWVGTVLEEFAGALFWFHPAVRWLLSRIRLTREQAVDAEVVRLTEPASYIEALLSMAVVSPARNAMPAAPFFTGGHLTHRMRELLTSPKRSVPRLLVSYVSAAAALLLFVWCVLLWFPLVGEAQVVALHAPRPRQVLLFKSQVDIRKARPSAPQDFTQQIVSLADTQSDVTYWAGVPEAGAMIGLLAEEAGPTLGLLVPPPPPSPPPPTVRRIAIGFDPFIWVQPGPRPSSEELDPFVAGFPEQSSVEVTRSVDGNVERIMVKAIRRLSDETIVPAIRIPATRPGASPAGPTEPADRVH